MINEGLNMRARTNKSAVEKWFTRLSNDVPATHDISLDVLHKPKCPRSKDIRKVKHLAT